MFYFKPGISFRRKNDLIHIHDHKLELNQLKLI